MSDSTTANPTGAPIEDVETITIIVDDDGNQETVPVLPEGSYGDESARFAYWLQSPAGQAEMAKAVAAKANAPAAPVVAPVEPPTVPVGDTTPVAQPTTPPTAADPLAQAANEAAAAATVTPATLS